MSKNRILSLVLALVMVLGAFGTVFADTVSPAKTQEEAAAFLKAKGLLAGNAAGDLMLDKELRRRDSVIMLAVLLGEFDTAKEFAGEPTFTDIKNEDGSFKDAFYVPFLKWAEENKYYEGRPNGEFGWDANLTAQEYSVVLLKSLGYTVNGEGSDVKWEEVTKFAKELGIFKGFETAEETKAILRGEMTLMTFNALGIKIKGTEQTLAAKLGVELPEADKPTELKVEKIYADNLKEITIELSNAELANKEKLENINNYRLSGNEIERVEVKDNDVLVQVKNVLRDGREYELIIKDVEKAMNGKHKFVAKDNAIPTVVEGTVKALGEYGITFMTSEPISNIRSNNFLIDGKNITMDVEQYGRTIILTPYRGSFSEDAKTLTIEGLKDFAGFKSEKEDFDIEIIKDKVAPEVVDVILKGDTVEVIFNKDIYESSVGAYWNRSDVGNISYELGRQNIYANKATKVDTNKVVYEFKNNEVPSRRDKVTIEGVQNHSKVKMEKVTLGLREVLDDIEPVILEKKMVAKSTSARTATVKLYFDKDVTGVFKGTSDHEFDVNAHFVLYEDEVATRYKSDEGVVTSAKYDLVDGEYVKDVIVVELTNLEVYDRLTNDLEYILEVEGFTNTTSSRYKMFRDYYEFKFTTSTDFVVTGGNVNYKGTDKTEITLNFNKYLDMKTAENPANYVFYYENDANEKVISDDLADLDGKAELVGNGTRVIITVPEDWADLIADFDGLRISDSIKDTAGNRLSETFYFDLGAELLVGKIETVAGALGAAITAANTELAKVTASQTAYTAAGGLATDKVYTDVTAAKTALDTLVTANNDTKAIRTATTTLKNALKALDEATIALNDAAADGALETAKTNANTELGKVAASTSAYTTAGGLVTNTVYTDVTAAAGLLQALVSGTDEALIVATTTTLENALIALDNATDVLVADALLSAADLSALAFTEDNTKNETDNVAALQVLVDALSLDAAITATASVVSGNYVVTLTTTNQTAPRVDVIAPVITTAE